MNERIQELAEQAGMHRDKFGMYFAGDKHNENGVDLEKFAQLIVMECCSVAKTVLYKETFGVEKRVSWNNGIAEALDTIVEHFGVEE